jgi:AraC family transcriptional regulator of adaptative response/methylated-DNA-[protein]-cysteine methyltransferase
LEFEDRNDLDKQLSRISKYFKKEIANGDHERFDKLRIQLDEYFKGERKKFELKTVLIGTDFQKSVWKEIKKIKFGKTNTYLKIANKLGNPKTVRAVAGANGANKLSIVIPCHRVLGSDGELVGYAGGLSRKQWLLDHESKQTLLDF